MKGLKRSDTHEDVTKEVFGSLNWPGSRQLVNPSGIYLSGSPSKMSASTTIMVKIIIRTTRKRYPFRWRNRNGNSMVLSLPYLALNTQQFVSHKYRLPLTRLKTHKDVSDDAH